MTFKKLDQLILPKVLELKKTKTQKDIAGILNDMGYRTNRGNLLEQEHVSMFLRAYNIKTQRKPRGKNAR
jgi:hypothetical protein